MTTLPVEVVETTCPHCEEPSLTLTFGLEGELIGFKQRCRCALSAPELRKVEDGAWDELQQFDYPHLRD